MGPLHAWRRQNPAPHDVIGVTHTRDAELRPMLG
jgi:hypothetical protein